MSHIPESPLHTPLGDVSKHWALYGVGSLLSRFSALHAPGVELRATDVRGRGNQHAEVE